MALILPVRRTTWHMALGLRTGPSSVSQSMLLVEVVVDIMVQRTCWLSLSRDGLCYLLLSYAALPAYMEMSERTPRGTPAPETHHESSNSVGLGPGSATASIIVSAIRDHLTLPQLSTILCPILSRVASGRTGVKQGACSAWSNYCGSTEHGFWQSLCILHRLVLFKP